MLISKHYYESADKTIPVQCGQQNNIHIYIYIYTYTYKGPSHVRLRDKQVRLLLPDSWKAKVHFYTAFYDTHFGDSKNVAPYLDGADRGGGQRLQVLGVQEVSGAGAQHLHDLDGESAGLPRGVGRRCAVDERLLERRRRRRRRRKRHRGGATIPQEESAFPGERNRNTTTTDTTDTTTTTASILQGGQWRRCAHVPMRGGGGSHGCMKKGNIKISPFSQKKMQDARCNQKNNNNNNNNRAAQCNNNPNSSSSSSSSSKRKGGGAVEGERGCVWWVQPGASSPCVSVRLWAALRSSPHGAQSYSPAVVSSCRRELRGNVLFKSS